MRGIIYYYICAKAQISECEKSMEKIFKAIGDFSRIRIINLLMNERLCVSELSNIMKISISAVSRHLSRLNLVGIINDNQEAQWVYYSIAEDFKKDNQPLFDYIQSIGQKDEMLMGDTTRMQRYKQSKFCCKDLTTCKIEVGKVMDGINE